MNRKFIFILFILLAFSFPHMVSAKVYECEYYYGNESNTFVMKYDNESGTYENLSEGPASEGIVNRVYRYYNYHFSKDEIKALGDNECPTLYVSARDEMNCSDPSTGSLVNTCDTRYYRDYYTDAFIREQDGYDKCINNKADTLVCLDTLFGGGVENYYTATLTKGDANSGNTEVTTCTSFTIYVNRIEESYDLYKAHSEDRNRATYITEANKNIDVLREFCSRVLGYRDIFIKIEDGEKLKDPCVESCLTLNEKIKEMQKGIVPEDEGQCGFSGKLLVFIRNILRWVKYILPAIVILLGILDFLRAIATSNDDSMKKAQGRFVKRLIAAALVFVIPFILEFILGKMGFAYDGCGIIQ